MGSMSCFSEGIRVFHSELANLSCSLRKALLFAAGPAGSASATKNDEW